MRLLTDEELEKIVDAWVHEDFSVRYIGLNRGHWERVAPTICKAQAELTESDTLKEVGDEMMKMSTLQEFHALRVRLIQGKLEVK